MDDKILDVINEISDSVKNRLYFTGLNLAEKVEKLKNDGIPTPTLSVCGRGTQEIRFTKYFSYYLNENNHHGLNDHFLRSVLLKEAEVFGLHEDWHKGCKVYSEYNLGTVPGSSHFNVIDIVIKGIGFTIFIEQKILSGESNFIDDSLSQLERYGKAIDEKFRQDGNKTIKIFLTPKGNIPSHIKDWIPVSHEDIIKRALPLLNSDHLSSNAKNNLSSLLIDFLIGPDIQYYEGLINTVSEIIDDYTNHTDIPIHRLLNFIEVVEKNKLFFDIWYGGEFSIEKTY